MQDHVADRALEVKPVRTTSPSSAYCRTWRVEQFSQRATISASTESSTAVTVFFAIPPPFAMHVRLLFVPWIVSSYARRATRLVPVVSQSLKGDKRTSIRFGFAKRPR